MLSKHGRNETAESHSAKRAKTDLTEDYDSDLPDIMNTFIARVKTAIRLELCVNLKAKYYHLFYQTRTGVTKDWGRVQKSTWNLYTKYGTAPIVKITSPHIERYLSEAGPCVPTGIEPTEESVEVKIPEPPRTEKSCTTCSARAAETLVTRLIDDEMANGLGNISPNRLEMSRQILSMAESLRGGNKCDKTEISPECETVIRASIRGITAYMKAVAVVLSDA